ncbi:hypothetical protein [Vibrio rotiferianus]|uniref:hypothetical protein n=1 Tax=Vibrio rotiferianus TaxID=190895 RepID=UPI00289522F4|nr:hypothetical protein THOG10_10596 [Vibrio rotiferianus]CAH1558996.1 hypothetical protein THOB06_10600 [Vibrio rotiferianus]
MSTVDLGLTSAGKYLKRLDQTFFETARLNPANGDIPTEQWTSLLKLNGSHIVDHIAFSGENSQAYKVKTVIDGVEMAEKTIRSQTQQMILGVSGYHSSYTDSDQMDGPNDYCKESYEILVYAPRTAGYGIILTTRYSQVEVADL